MPSATLRPGARGSLTGLLDFPSAGENYTKVDEASADDDSTYVYLVDALGFGTVGTDLYAVPSILGLGHVAQVKVYARCKSHTGAGNTVKPSFRIAGTTYQGTAQTLGGSYTNYSFTYTPTVEWDSSDVDGLEIGLTLELPAGSNFQARCTQVWVEVDYIPLMQRIVIASGEKMTLASGEKLTIA